MEHGATGGHATGRSLVVLRGVAAGRPHPYPPRLRGPLVGRLPRADGRADPGQGQYHPQQAQGGRRPDLRLGDALRPELLAHASEAHARTDRGLPPPSQPRRGRAPQATCAEAHVVGEGAPPNSDHRVLRQAPTGVGGDQAGREQRSRRGGLLRHACTCRPPPSGHGDSSAASPWAPVYSRASSLRQACTGVTSGGAPAAVSCDTAAPRRPCDLETSLQLATR